MRTYWPLWTFLSSVISIPCMFHIHVNFFLPSLLSVSSMEVRPTMSDLSRGRNTFSHEHSWRGTASKTNASRILLYFSAVAQIHLPTPSRRVWLWVCCCCLRICRSFEFHIIDHIRSRLHKSLRASSACANWRRHSVSRKFFQMTCFWMRLDGRCKSKVWTLTGLPPPCWSACKHKAAIKGK